MMVMKQLSMLVLGCMTVAFPHPMQKAFINQNPSKLTSRMTVKGIEEEGLSVNKKVDEIDDGLYSRQLFVLGREGQHKLQESKVLVIGMSGIGVEIVKNLALAGVSDIHLYDPCKCQLSDLSNNYYINTDHIDNGVNRVDAVLPHLSSLNPQCSISNQNINFINKSSCSFGTLSDVIEKGRYNCVISIDQSQHIEKNLNDIVRNQSNNCSFISCGGCGVFGNIFCDFGESFHVLDPSGVESKTIQIHDISLLEEDSSAYLEKHIKGTSLKRCILCDVVCDEDESHDLSVGNKVVLNNIEWKFSNEDKSHCVKKLSAIVVKVINQHSLTLLIDNEGDINEEYNNILHKVLEYRKASFKSGTMVRPKYDESYDMSFQSLNTLLKKATAPPSSPMKSVNKRSSKTDVSPKLWSSLFSHRWRSKSNTKTSPHSQRISRNKEAVFHVDKIPIVPCDWGKANKCRTATVHALWRYALPLLRSQEKTQLSSSDCQKLVKHFIGNEIDKYVCTAFAHCYSVRSKLSKEEPDRNREHVTLAPVAYFIGSVAAQEALKALTGVFSPLHQFLYFDAIELLDKKLNLSKKSHVAKKDVSEDVSVRGDRYDAQRLLLGEETCRRLREKKWFLVGAGAIGCELLKNAAMLGMCSSELDSSSEVCPDGRGLIVTDMDTIERSNLNRQFLFRSHNIGDYKSFVACEAAKIMNPSMVLTPLKSAINEQSCADGCFDDDFWSGLDGVWTALDNMESRLFIDEKCVKYKKPLIDAGTLGTKGNVQVVIPYLTESYGDSSDPTDEDNIPVCTIKSYPYRPEHTVQWARELFDELFVKIPNTITNLVKIQRLFPSLNATDFLDEELEEELRDDDYLDKVLGYLNIIKVASSMKYDDTATNDISEIMSTLADGCFDFAVSHILCSQFMNPINNQRDRYGEDVIDEESGLPFWSGNRKRPLEFKLNHKSTYQVSLVLSSARLLCQAFIGRNLTPFEKRQYFSELEAVGFIQQKQLEQDGDCTVSESPKDTLNRLLKSYQEIGDGLTPLEFEKDDESNGQIGFIASASNLRSVFYGIDPLEELQVKKIAGRILPAIATTTAAVAALSTIEMIKLVQSLPLSVSDKKDGLPLFAFSEPVETSEYSLGNEVNRYFSSWDVYEVNPNKADISLVEFVKRVETYGGVSGVKSIISNDIILVGDVPSEMSARLLTGEKDSFVELIFHKNVCDANKTRTQFIDLEVLVEDDSGEVVDFPPVRFYLPLRC